MDTLSTNLRARVITPPIEGVINRTIHQALSRLNIIRFKPRWKYLYMSLMRVLHPPALTISAPPLDNEAKTQSAGMVVIDGFGDPYWPERWAAEDKRVKRGSTGISSGDNIGLNDITKLVQAVREQMGTVVFLSIQGLWVSSIQQIFSGELKLDRQRPLLPSSPLISRNHTLHLSVSFKGKMRVFKHLATSLSTFSSPFSVESALFSFPQISL